uniref:MedDCM-OCT-S36-C39-cds31 n=1 Tax=Candidatus Actinomarina minuta TaxID=1389454 RepID=S5DWW1_9ACTN|nr:MedDCM-OCT-S36-C39-cds31 [Candidatus Actinomarina minuta]
MKKILLFLVFLLITSCTTSTGSDVDESKTATGEEISFDQGLGKNPTEFVSNWNKLVDEISEDEETLLYFSINPDKVQWASTDQKILFYQFGLSENTKSTFILNILIDDDIVEGVEFFSPVADDEVTSQRTRLFFLIIIAMSDDTLNKEGRDSVLSKVGLYDEVDNPNQIGGGVSINNIRYVVEPLVDRGVLRGINFYTTRESG